MVAKINSGTVAMPIDATPAPETVVYGVAGTTTLYADPTSATTDNTTMYIIAGIASFVVGYILMRR